MRVAQAGYRDVLLVFSSLDSSRIFEEVRRRPPYSIERVVRIDRCCRADIGEIVRTAIDLGRAVLSRGDRVRVECAKRGSAIESCRSVEIAVGMSIEKAGLATADPRNPSKVIKVELLGEMACIGIIRPGGDRPHRSWARFEM